MNYFCTLFDSHYLSRGLVMYHSLLATGCEFQLYVYAFDDLCADILLRMALPQVTIVTMEEFEDERLLQIKPTRSRGEYCWTCASHVIAHSLRTFQLPEVTYLDADLFFYDIPNVLLDEFNQSGASVLISPHRYTPCYDLSTQSGLYCVQFMTFRSDSSGLTALSWWQERTLEWCFDRKENGLFGDQKYLDDWPERFSGVHVLTHLGGGVAPWNIQQYNVHKTGEKLFIDDTLLVFYHFHGYKFYQDGSQNLGDYRLSASSIDLLYRPYVHAIQSTEFQVRSYSETVHGSGIWDTSLRARLGRLYRKLKGEYNVFREL